MQVSQSQAEPETGQGSEGRPSAAASLVLLLLVFLLLSHAALIFHPLLLLLLALILALGGFALSIRHLQESRCGRRQSTAACPAGAVDARQPGADPSSAAACNSVCPPPTHPRPPTCCFHSSFSCSVMLLQALTAILKSGFFCPAASEPSSGCISRGHMARTPVGREVGGARASLGAAVPAAAVAVPLAAGPAP